MNIEDMSIEDIESYLAQRRAQTSGAKAGSVTQAMAGAQRDFTGIGGVTGIANPADYIRNTPVAGVSHNRTPAPVEPGMDERPASVTPSPSPSPSIQAPKGDVATNNQLTEAYYRIKRGKASDEDLLLFKAYSEDQLRNIGFGSKSITAIRTASAADRAQADTERAEAEADTERAEAEADTERAEAEGKSRRGPNLFPSSLSQDERAAMAQADRAQTEAEGKSRRGPNLFPSSLSQDERAAMAQADRAQAEAEGKSRHSK